MEPTDFRPYTPELDRAIEQGLVPDQLGMPVDITPEIVRNIAAAIPNHGQYELCLPENLRPTLDAIRLYPGYRAPMLLGRAGLPNTSAKLVEMGVFYIDDDHVVLHPVLQRAFDAKEAERDALLARLKRMHDEIQQGNDPTV